MKGPSWMMYVYNVFSINSVFPSGVVSFVGTRIVICNFEFQIRQKFQALEFLHGRDDETDSVDKGLFSRELLKSSPAESKDVNLPSKFIPEDVYDPTSYYLEVVPSTSYQNRKQNLFSHALRV